MPPTLNPLNPAVCVTALLNITVRLAPAAPVKFTELAPPVKATVGVKVTELPTSSVKTLLAAEASTASAKAPPNVNEVSV